MSAADIRAMAEAIYDDLLADSVLSTTIEAHREIKRGQVVCATCGTRCRAHVPINPIASGVSSAATSREASPIKAQSTRPNGYTVGPEKGTGGGTGVGSGSGRIDGSGNAFFDCLVCGRSVTSTRYAPHLASCLGYSGSTRRGTSRMAAAKARLGANDRASPSPYLASDVDSDADSVGGKRKKLSSLPKRAASPTKVFKKKHMTHSGSAPPASKPHQPSRLGRPPITKAHSASSYDDKPAAASSRGASARPSPAPSFRASASHGAHSSSQLARESSVASASSARAGSVGSAGSSAGPASATGSGGSGTSVGTANTGSRGGKTLPGTNVGPGVSGQISRQGSRAGSVVPEAPGDESSEADDDY